MKSDEKLNKILKSSIVVFSVLTEINFKVNKLKYNLTFDDNQGYFGNPTEIATGLSSVTLSTGAEENINLLNDKIIVSKEILYKLEDVNSNSSLFENDDHTLYADWER